MCEKHKCYKVLGVANTVSPVSTMESIEHVDLFKQLGLMQNYRIAWVELNQESVDAVHLTEGLLSSHGVTCRVFIDIDEAREWLFFERLNT